MKKLSLLVSLLTTLFFAKSADASDIYISNCTAKPVRNPATNTVDVELKAEVCTTDTSSGLNFEVRFYPDSDSAPALPPDSPDSDHSVIGSISTGWNWWWYYHGNCQEVTTHIQDYDLPMGEYKLYCVLDPEDEIGTEFDSNNSNNLFGPKSWRIGPDLYVQYFNYVINGAELIYKFKVCNRGTHKASNFRVGVYYDRNSPPGPGHYSDVFESFTDLDPPECQYRHWSGGFWECTPVCTEKDVDGDKKPDPIEIRRNPTPNDVYKSWVKADSGEFVDESDESNNIGRPLTIDMANPNLVITKFSASVSNSPPYSINYDVEVCNIGAKGSGVFWIDLYYHRDRDNPPTTGQPGEIHLKEKINIWGDLPTEEQSPRPSHCIQHQFVRYGVTDGEYQSYLQVDSDEFVVDPDRSDNLEGPLIIDVPSGQMPTGCIDNDNDGYGYGSDCPEDATQDCDDDDDTVYPGAEEICRDGIDQNCNGTADDGCPGVDCEDEDGDGVPAGPDCVDDYNDCDDNDPDRFPGNPEICGNNIDNDCDGYADDCCPGVNYCDEDGDGACTGTDCPGPRDPDCVAACNGNISCIQSCPLIPDPACVEACAGDQTCIDNCPPWLDPDCVEACAGDQTCIDECPPVQDGDDNNSDCGWSGSVEICGNHVDDDCNGLIDDGCPGTYCEDKDKDGFGVGVGCPGPQDCNDENANINPGAEEICGNGIDEDCDGVPDGMCDTCVDNDGDGYYSGNGADCNGKPKDCNDEDPLIHPGGYEICGNDIDENCNLSITDTPCVDPSDYEECMLLMPDTDDVEQCLDEHNDSDPDNCLAWDTADSPPCHDPACIMDCHEECGNTTECSTFEDCVNNCDEWIETCVDNDGDGWGEGPGCSSWDDCDDEDDSIHPGAEEICDGIDNDCDGTVDEWPANGTPCLDPDCLDNCGTNCDCPEVDCVDHDGDGWGVGADCDEQDPDDNDPATYPGAREICGDGIDQDGDGAPDNGCVLCRDHDGDDFGVGPGCAQMDCDDSNPDIYPGAPEKCGRKDLDCDGKPPAATVCQSETASCNCRQAGSTTTFPLKMVLFLLLFSLITRFGFYLKKT
ncbi:MAG: MopE-related protein [Myxococcota bacterium]